MAARVDGRFWMYWGEGTCFAATSDDLVRWTPLEFDATGDRYLSYDPDGEHGAWDVHRVPGQRVLRPLLFPRRGRFDSLLVEPGPPAVLTDDGIVLIANGANHPEHGDPSLPGFAYQPGQVLFDPADPASCIARSIEPFLRPEAIRRAGRPGRQRLLRPGPGAVRGDEWLLYFGMADSRIGLARRRRPSADR